MGRAKLTIKRLENSNNRQVSYSKRRNGILKKAREISILCDIDLVLIMFSPTGKPTLRLGERSNLEEVIGRFAQLTPQERAKRKLESLEALKKTFKKLDHDVSIEDFLGASNQTTEELHNELRHIKLQLSDVEEKLWFLGNEPDHITTLQQAKDVEETIHKAIIRMQNHKNYHSGLSLPLLMEGGHQPQPTSWTSMENQQIILHKDPSLVLSQRDVDHVDNHLPNPPVYVLNGMQSDIDENPNQQESYFNELNQGKRQRLQLGNHYSHLQHQYNSFPEDKRFKMEMDMNLQGTTIDLQNHGFETLGIAFDGLPQQWPTSSNHAIMSLFEKYSFPQQQSLTILDGFSTSMHQQMDSLGDQN